MLTPAPPKRKREASLSNASSSRAGTRSRTTSDVSASRSRPRSSAAPKGKGKGKAPRSSANPQLSFSEPVDDQVRKPKTEESDEAADADPSGPESEWTARWNEEFFEIVDELPLELHRSFALIRELETKTQAQMARIGRDAIAYRDIRLGIKSEGEAPAPSTAKALRLSLLRSIAESSADALRASEEKVGLAVSAYDWVDRHIRRLDNDLQKSESSLLLGLREGTEASRGVREALRMPVPGATTGADTSEVAGDGDESRAANETWVDEAAASSARTSPITRSSRRSSARSGSAGAAAAAAPVTRASSAATTGGRTRAESTSTSALAAAPATSTRSGAGSRSRAKPSDGLAAAPSSRKRSVSGGAAASTASAHAASTSPVQVPSSLVPDMAIDPNEPTYCYCDQVSFGDMVACDNEDCPREWYHLSCVGLDEPPPRHSKWYCLHCAPPGYRHAASVDPSLPFVPRGYKKATSAERRQKWLA